MTGDRGARESIWSVSKTLQLPYFLLFSVLFIGGIVFSLTEATAELSGWRDYAGKSWSYAAPVAITSAAGALIIVEAIALVISALVWVADITLGIIDWIGGFFVVIAAFLKEKYGFGRMSRRSKRKSSDDETIDRNLDQPPQIMSTPPARVNEPQEPREPQD